MTAGRILVTGATGFIGREVVSALLGRGALLTIVFRDAGRCPVIWRAHPSIRLFHRPDMESLFTGEGLWHEVKTVVHLAGLAHVRERGRSGPSDDFSRINSEMTAKLAQAAHAAGAMVFVHLSSLAAATPNAASCLIDDDSTWSPDTEYGRSKRDAEQQVRTFFANEGGFGISLRPPLVVGAAAPGNWASLQALVAKGFPLPFASIRNQRSFVSVETVADAICTLCEGNWPADRSGEYCLADPDLLSLPDVVGELRMGMNLPGRLFPFPASAISIAGGMLGRKKQVMALTGNLRVDASRFFQTFSFYPKLSIREAVRRSGERYIRRITAPMNGNS